MRELTSMLVSNSEFTYTLINFIIAFERRILTALRFKGYIDGKMQFKSFSIAKLEEIEHIVNLISFCFLNYSQWRDQNQDQADCLVNILFSFTINLFKSNVVLNDCFHPISHFEKYIHNLSDFKGDELSSQDLRDPELGIKKTSSNFSSISQTDKKNMVNKVVTSLRTPMKGESSAQSFSMLDNDQYSRQAYKSSNLGNYFSHNYKPNAFILKVEVTLSKIALMMLRSMHLILKHEIRMGPSSDFVNELSYYHEKNNETRLFLVCSNIFD